VNLFERLVLADGLVVRRIGDLPRAVRRGLEAPLDSVAVSLPGSRSLAQLIGADAAAFLDEFGTPCSIPDAVLSYSVRSGVAPEALLEDIYPLVQQFCRAGFLVSPAGMGASTSATLPPDAEVSNARVVRAVHITVDTEIYQVRIPDGTLATMKRLRPGASPVATAALEREIRIIARLDGAGAPRLLGTGVFAGTRYLLEEWCGARRIDIAAQESEAADSPDDGLSIGRLGLAGRLIETYASLHEAGVLHGDVHPGNVIVSDEGRVSLVDFGFGRLINRDEMASTVFRVGVGYYFEPEYARAILLGETAPSATAAGEQYAVGALAYELLSGRRPIELSLDRRLSMQQIAEEPPKSLGLLGTPWEEIEQILLRALSKDPVSRFPQMRSMAEAFSAQARAAADHVMDNRSQSPHGGSRSRERQNRVAGQGTQAIRERYGLESRLIERGLTDAPTASISFGASGVAWVLYRVAELEEDAELLAAADIWSARAHRDIGSKAAFVNARLDLTEDTLGSISIYHAEPGVHLTSALVATGRGDTASTNAEVEHFVRSIDRPCRRLDLTAGLASALLGCVLLLKAVPKDLTSRPKVEAAGAQLYERIAAVLRELGSIGGCETFPWLGIAHGWAGVLFGLLRWAELTNQDPLSDIADRLDQLGALAIVKGRGLTWPRAITFTDRSASGTLGWCHGSAGHALLWAMAHRITGQQNFARFAASAANDAWDNANPVDATLCCGLTGQAYAQLALYRLDGSASWLGRARELGARARTRPSGFLDSLYEGRLGQLLFDAEIVRPDRAAVPVMESAV
jgi:eukaryotic-like serine/threonine-protein kinase